MPSQARPRLASPIASAHSPMPRGGSGTKVEMEGGDSVDKSTLPAHANPHGREQAVPGWA
ncbi:hypothetical protein NH8B_0239 [Pseudogulbenkiania sp. NH8B]|nr:hypothetical protein NH8B_0239 [Pseudogulbenkiania sp. NH8B]